MAAAGEAPEVGRRLRFVSVGCSSWGLSTAGTTTLSGVTALTTRRAASGSCPGDLRGVARLGQREQCGGGEQAGRDAEADASPDGPSEKTPTRVNGSPRGVTSDRPRDQFRGQSTDGEIASDLRFCEQGGPRRTLVELYPVPVEAGDQGLPGLGPRQNALQAVNQATEARQATQRHGVGSSGRTLWLRGDRVRAGNRVWRPSDNHLSAPQGRRRTNATSAPIRTGGRDRSDIIRHRVVASQCRPAARSQCLHGLPGPQAAWRGDAEALGPSSPARPGGTTLRTLAASRFP